MLIDSGIKPTMKDDYGKNVLHYFDLDTENQIEEDVVLIMLETLILQNLCINIADGWGFTPLLQAT